MRQHKILAQTLLILSVINFALAAPAAAREKLEACLSTSVTAALQERRDEFGVGGLSPNVPGPDHWQTPPPSPDFADVLSQILHTGNPPPPPDSPELLAGLDYVQPSPEFPTGSRLLVGPMPVAGSLSPPPPPPPHPSQPGPSEDRLQGLSVNPDTLSSTGKQPTPSHGSPVLDPEIHSLLHPEPFPTEFWDKLLKGLIKRRISGQKDQRSLKYSRRRHPDAAMHLHGPLG